MRFNYIKLDQNPYAISSAQVDKTLWPQAEQVITYNTYNKMTSIQEPVDAFMLNIQYGHDHQRIYQELNENSIITARKTFVGEGLEIVEKPQSGTVQKIHYLSGGDGNLFAMYIIDQNNVGTLYYLFTDHLGSPNLITDASGNTVQELSFDAWGKRRDPATWQPYATNATIPAAFIDRGFTFHEHLYPFTLINMNGRAYDPLVGRFLSADPYIQAPDNPQNLNRYSYCLNNPLRYSDPSGEFLIEAMIIGGLANWIMSGCEFNWDGAASFAIGAVAGAIGAGVGAGVNASIAGASFGSGFMGTATVSSTGFIAGAATGFSGGFAGGFVNGFGNAAIDGQNIGDMFFSGIKEGVIGGTLGGIIGGVSGGIHALNNDRSFWTGAHRTYKIPDPPLLASTDNMIVVNQEDFTVINNSGETIYYKPETSDPLRGIKGDGAYPIKNGRGIKHAVDGVTAPCNHAKVFKITNPFNKSSINVSYNSISIDKPYIVGELLINETLGGGWLLTPPDQGWNQIFKMAGYAFK